ncbi:MAG: helix-turn-helix domain-containing protein [Planctomycetes bacterium]|nr:helix-turn-helix domain-containing protein [Planctomycetota bacterium]
MEISAEQVKNLRHRLGLTQAQMARALQVTEQTIYNWERGLALPTRYDAVIMNRLWHMAQTADTRNRAREALVRAAEAKAVNEKQLAAAIIGSAVGLGLGLLLAELFGGADSGRRRSTATRSSKRRGR